MKVEKIKGHTIRFYDSISELPITVFHDYNRYLLIDSGIGSDMESVDEHLNRLYHYFNTGNKIEGIQELDNLRQNIFFVINSKSPKFMAGACLIHSIDGVEIKDRSDTGIKDTIKAVEKVGLSSGNFSNIIEDIKKKILRS